MREKEYQGNKDSYLIKTYHENGNLEVLGLVRSNLCDSIWQYFYDNNQLFYKKKFNHGKPIYDTLTVYFESGIIKCKGFQHGAYKDGEWYFYYENANKKCVGTYKVSPLNYPNSEPLQGHVQGYTNFPIGVWNFYYESGELLATIEYTVFNRKRSGNIIIELSKIQNAIYFDKLGNKIKKSMIDKNIIDDFRLVTGYNIM